MRNSPTSRGAERLDETIAATLAAADAALLTYAAPMRATYHRAPRNEPHARNAARPPLTFAAAARKSINHKTTPTRRLLHRKRPDATRLEVAESSVGMMRVEWIAIL